MPVSRIDLDGKGAGSPEGLVTLILKNEPDLSIPVPIEKLCAQLDVIEIQALETEGFEGGLITTPERTNGIILVNENSHRFRQRFTIGHELGHFLIPTHMPAANGRFLCSREDLRLLSAKENDRRAVMEVEANRFSSLILIPPPLLRKEFAKNPEPDLRHILDLAWRFEVSKEAMSRAYADHHPDLVAVLVTQNGKVLRPYRNRFRFPFIQLDRGALVPKGSLYHRVQHSHGFVSEMEECTPDLWIDVERGRRAPTLFEQVHSQRDGFGLILLHLIQTDEDEEAEEHDLERSWQPRFRR